MTRRLPPLAALACCLLLALPAAAAVVQEAAASGNPPACADRGEAATPAAGFFTVEPVEAAACSASARCNDGSRLACSDPGGRCSGVNGCYVLCGCEVTWCPNPSGPLGLPCPLPITCDGT
jgi:hypothetical protein